MSTILCQIIMTLNLAFGTNSTTQAQSVSRTGFEVVAGVVIIDTDEL